MKIITKTGWLGFILTLSALNVSVVQAASSPTQEKPLSLENRLNRIAATLKDRENHLSEREISESNPKIAVGWANGSGGRGFVNGRRAGWGDGHRGGFANINPWRNGWGDRGGFFNSNPWRNGWGDRGGFFNGRW